MRPRIPLVRTQALDRPQLDPFRERDRPGALRCVGQLRTSCARVVRTWSGAKPAPAAARLVVVLSWNLASPRATRQGRDLAGSGYSGQDAAHQSSTSCTLGHPIGHSWRTAAHQTQAGTSGPGQPIRSTQALALAKPTKASALSSDVLSSDPLSRGTPKVEPLRCGV